MRIPTLLLLTYNTYTDIVLSNNKMGVTRGPDAQYTIACEKRASLPDPSFTLSGYDFVIGPEDYIFEIDGGYMSALMTNHFPPGGPLAVSGYAFLRKWYSVFDLGDNSISLAEAKQ